MKKLLTEERPYSLVVASESLFYRVNRTGYAGQGDGFFQHNLTRSWEITEQQYYQAKYHAPLLPYERGEVITFLPNGDSLRCASPDSIVRQFNPAGQLLRELPTSIEATMNIESLTLDSQGQLWTAEPAFHHIAQYELASAKKLYEVGGSWEPGELNYPEEVICYEQDIFISDMGYQRLLKLNSITKVLSTYRNFSQNIWEYRRVKEHEVVRLEDGIYVL